MRGNSKRISKGVCHKWCCINERTEMSFNTKRNANAAKKSWAWESKQQQVTLVTKRIAETSPGSTSKKKRFAFGDLTNAIASNTSLDVKKDSLAEEKNAKKAKRVHAILNNVLYGNNASKDSLEEPKSSQESFFSTKSKVSQSNKSIKETEDDAKENSPLESPVPVLPPGVEDFDQESSDDQFSEPNFAMDIFRYYRKREVLFQLDDYLLRQTEVSKGMRAILIDWMVEVQESFELNHETLYLGVKLVDHYLFKHVISKSSLQLLGATAIFIACKFDERCPPLVDDILYICDDAYGRKELIAMETNILKTMDFDIGIPLSYRFLRRYARCAKVTMEIITLARFILETSLMDYDFIQIADSKMAAASLLLALKMKDIPEWTPTLEYYTNYKESDLTELMYRLNDMISAPSQKNLMTIRTKYSHKVFFAVAKIPPLPPQAT